MDGRRDVWCGSPDPNDDRDLGPHEPARAEAIFGRTKVDGAPLSGGDEFTEPDFGAMGRDDVPLIAMDSHMRLAHPSRHGGVRMLRRGYNYTDGSDGLGRLDAGLFFLAYQRDVRTSFLPVQQMLARSDTLNSTSGTPVRRCLRFRRAWPRADTSARRCSRRELWQPGCDQLPSRHW